MQVMQDRWTIPTVFFMKHNIGFNVYLIHQQIRLFMDFRVSLLYKEAATIVPNQQWVDATGFPFGNGGELICHDSFTIPFVGDCVSFAIAVESNGKRIITQVEGKVESRKFNYVTPEICNVQLIIIKSEK